MTSNCRAIRTGEREGLVMGQAVAPAPHRGAHRTGRDGLDESVVEAAGQAEAQRAEPDLDPGWSTIRR